MSCIYLSTAQHSTAQHSTAQHSTSLTYTLKSQNEKIYREVLIIHHISENGGAGIAV